MSGARVLRPDQRGAADGVAALASGGRVPTDQLPAGITVADGIGDAIGEWWIYPTVSFSADRLTTFTGGVASDGKVVVAALNHGVQLTKRVEVGQAVVDDHCRPAVFVKEGHRTVVLWNNHNLDGVRHFKVGGFGTIDGLDLVDEQTTVSTSTKVSYNQLQDIAALSTATDDVFLLFERRYQSDVYTWRVAKMTVNRATGAVTVTPTVTLFSFGGSDQGYIITAPSYDANDTIRIGISINPSNADVHDIYYAEMRPVTGEVLDQAGTVHAGLGSGTATGLPILSTSLPVAVAAPSGGTARLFHARPGPARAALACATWTSGDVDTYRHVELHPAATVANPGLVVTAGQSGAKTPHFTGLNDNGQVHVDVVIDPTTLAPSALSWIARRWDPNNVDNMWRLGLNTAGTLRFEWSQDGTGAATKIATSTAAVPAGTNGFRVAFEDGPVSTTTTATCNFYTSSDHGSTWTQLGSTVNTTIVAGAGMHQSVDRPLEIGNETGAGALAGVYRSATVYAGFSDTTVIAFEDFVAGGWTNGQSAGSTTRTRRGTRGLSPGPRRSR